MPAVALRQKQSSIMDLRQEQTMTHQQIQALELLSIPVLELEHMVNEELATNPTLESDAEGQAEEELPANLEDEEWLEMVMMLDDNRRFLSSPSRYVSSDEEEQQRHFLESVVYQQSLHDSLFDQLRLSDVPDEIRECAETVISGLDEDGYLTSHPADLAMVAGVSMDAVNEALVLVQGFDPPGIAARDLRERLLLQLARQGRQDSKAYEAVEQYFDELAANHIPLVARKMKVPLEELQEILEQIKGLTPHVSDGYTSPHEYIQEEVTVEEKDGELRAHMKNDYLPSLHISQHYRQLLNAPETGKDVREYVKEKIRSGVFMINSIIQRQTTIQKIVNALMERQEDFFIHGPEFLKPLTMASIADQVGVHETTVSRAVAGKYLRCKHGLIALRDFFTTGYRDEDGNNISNSVVKTVIRRLIANETPDAPYSDSQIAAELKKSGLKVARRTVAKYREAEGILPSNLRRQF